MSEVSLTAGGRNDITVRLEPNSIYGQNRAGQPSLHLPLQIQLLLAGEQRNVKYQLIRLAGTLQSQPVGELASFELDPLVEVPRPAPYFSPQGAWVQLGRGQINRFEEARAGKDAHLQISLSGLLWYPTQATFEVARSSSYLDVVVPRSQWADRVLSAWNLSKIKVVEIRFPESEAGENFRTAYAKIEAAEKLYANGDWKHTLGELYSAFESLAKGSGFANPDQQFFADLLSASHPAKKEKFKRSLDSFCDLLHLGRHEPKDPADGFEVSRQDARFALIMAQAIFEYITPNNLIRSS